MDARPKTWVSSMTRRVRLAYCGGGVSGQSAAGWMDVSCTGARSAYRSAASCSLVQAVELRFAQRLRRQLAHGCALTVFRTSALSPDERCGSYAARTAVCVVASKFSRAANSRRPNTSRMIVLGRAVPTLATQRTGEAQNRIRTAGPRRRQELHKVPLECRVPRHGKRQINQRLDLLVQRRRGERPLLRHGVRRR